jgi:hypothetical protein
MRQFMANPIRHYHSIELKPSEKQLVEPEPFNLSSLALHEKCQVHNNSTNSLAISFLPVPHALSSH